MNLLDVAEAWGWVEVAVLEEDWADVAVWFADDDETAADAFVVADDDVEEDVVDDGLVMVTVRLGWAFCWVGCCFKLVGLIAVVVTFLLTDSPNIDDNEETPLIIYIYI